MSFLSPSSNVENKLSSNHVLPLHIQTTQIHPPNISPSILHPPSPISAIKNTSSSINHPKSIIKLNEEGDKSNSTLLCRQHQFNEQQNTKIEAFNSSFKIPNRTNPLISKVLDVQSNSSSVCTSNRSPSTAVNLLALCTSMGLLTGVLSVIGGIYLCFKCFGVETKQILFNGQKCYTEQRWGGPFGIMVGIFSCGVSIWLMIFGRSN